MRGIRELFVLSLPFCLNLNYFQIKYPNMIFYKLYHTAGDLALPWGRRGDSLETPRFDPGHHEIFLTFPNPVIHQVSFCAFSAAARCGLILGQ